MAITKEKKKELISQYQNSKNDSGSPEVQVAILTERINQLTSHFTTNPKDHQGQCGLLKMVGKRKKQLSYLKKINSEEHRRIVDQLALRN